MPGPTNNLLKMEDVIAGVEGCWTRLRQTNESLAHLCFSQGLPAQATQFNSKMISLGVEIRCIKKLDLESLKSLIDESECYISDYMKKIIDEISRVAMEYRRLVESSPYGRRLSAELGQYVVELERLQWLNDMAFRRWNYQAPRAADLPQPHNSPKFCRGALQMINNNDRGDVAQVPASVVNNLEAEDKEKIRDGGFYLYWKCTSCAFKIRYLVKSSRTSTVSTTDLIRRHSGMEYRPSFLVKSHLRIRNPDSSRKYGCIFCFAEGRTSDIYSHGKILMQHIRTSHNSSYPARLFLEKLNIRANGVFLPSVPFDIHLTGT